MHNEKFVSPAPTTLSIWSELTQHQKTCVNETMRDYFLSDPNRFDTFSIEAAGIVLDYSKNRITHKTRELLCELAKTQKVTEKITALFAGDIVNVSEHRPALHPWLRALPQLPPSANEPEAITAARSTYQRMQNLTDAFTHSAYIGATGKPITDVVNLGIGGSHWGAACAYTALTDYHIPHLQCHFVADLDPTDFYQTVKHLSPETTLFIVASKSFTTTETLANAALAKAWLKKSLSDQYQRHFIGITAYPKRAEDFGILPENIFTIDNSIGGRYSIWSAMGLPLMLGIGRQHFADFLAGATTIDHHTRTAPLSENMPAIMALLSVWYINFFQANTHAILPYAHQLNLLLPYIQQLEMESNGKHCRHHGETTAYTTGAVVWGGVGIHGQHTFNQMLHQGTHLIPVDFILPMQNSFATQAQQAQVIAQCLGQSRTLMWGKTLAEASKQGNEHLAQHKTLSGNNPSNLLLISTISPATLGALFALYEHKVFIQAAIWDINPFDQWGVEYGKEIAQLLLPSLLTETPTQTASYDASTKALIHHYHCWEETV